jgi:hypothetical protein
MREPKRIPLDPDTPKASSVKLNRLSSDNHELCNDFGRGCDESNVTHLYDNFGYVTSIEINYENSQKSTET